MNVQVTTVVMLLLLAGIALIGVGTSTLMKENPRQTQLANYKEALTTYKASIATAVSDTKVEVILGGVNVPLAKVASDYTFSGDQQDIPPQTDNMLRQWTLNVTAQNTYTLVITRGSVRQPNLDLPPIQIGNPVDTPMNCTDDAPDTGCTETYLRDQCREYARTQTATYVANPASLPTCKYNSINCGVCQFVVYLTGRCNFLKFENNAWGLVRGTEGFVYPFQYYNHLYSTTYQPLLNLSIRAYEEPFNTAQNETSGAMDFGQTLEDQRKQGLAITATGAAMVLLCVAGVIFSKVVLTKIKKKNQMETLEGAQSKEMTDMSNSARTSNKEGGSSRHSGKGSDHGRSRRGSQTSQDKGSSGKENSAASAPPQGFGPSAGGPSNWTAPPEWQRGGGQQQQGGGHQQQGQQQHNSGNNSEGGSSKGRSGRQKNYRGDRGSGHNSENEGGGGGGFAAQKGAAAASAGANYNRQQIAQLVGAGKQQAAAAAAPARGPPGKVPPAAAGGWGGGQAAARGPPGGGPPAGKAPPQRSKPLPRDDDL